MTSSREDMIASLTQDLEPVRAYSARNGAALLAIAGGLTVIGVLLIEGIWHGMTNGDASAFFWVTNGLLTLLGLASSAAVIAMASPRVGGRSDAPLWLGVMLVILPIVAVLSVVRQQHGMEVIANDMYGFHCLSHSLFATVLMFASLTVWLRRGAPVSVNSAGWLTGVASGSLGAVAYGISCSIDSITHLGIWHVAPVAISAIAGRLIVPHLVRW
jgi:hypothetical protein